MPSPCLFLTVCVLLAARISEGAASYSIVDIGGFFPGDSVQAGGINNNGVVIGTDGTRLEGFYWDGSLHALPPLAADSSSGPTAINSQGWIAGQSFTSASQSGALWINGTPSRLPVPGTTTYPDGINTSGSIVGNYHSGSSTRAFLLPYGASSITALGTLGGANSQAYAINDAGKVVGSADTANGNSHAFSWSAGHMTQLSDLGLSSAAYCINQQGIAGGFVLRPDFTRQAVLWSANGTMTSMPNPQGYANAEVWGVNLSGVAVGVSDGGAIIWENGTSENLISLIGANSGWNTLNFAYGINDSGEIVGWGTRDNSGTQHAFLLEPVPEPGTFAFAALFIVFFATSPILRRVVGRMAS
jgi:probable HAF family extracellular repeat protein